MSFAPAPVLEDAIPFQDPIDEICAEVSRLIAEGVRFIVLSDRDHTTDLAPIPSLLLTSAVHHHLVRQKERTMVSLVVEAGDVREVHHVALLIGYGAAAVNPYLAMETVEEGWYVGGVALPRDRGAEAVARELEARFEEFCDRTLGRT